MNKNFAHSLAVILTIIIGAAFTGSISAQTLNGTLDFGNPTDGTVLLNAAGSRTITTDGAAATGGFGIIRQGTTGGSFTLLNPGTTIGTQGEFRIIAPTSTSINSAGIRSTEYGTASQLTTISYDAFFSGGTNGSYVFNVGNGATFTSNTVAFTGAESFVVLTFTYGAGNTITTTNRANATNVALANFTFAQNVAYNIRIVGNNSAATVNYGSGQSVASGTYDLYVNGTLVENDLAKAALPIGTNINAFRYYGQSSTTPANNSAALNLDNVTWSSEVPPVVAANNPPTITAASGVSQVRGTTTTGVTIATVTDENPGAVVVTVTSANPSNGVTLANITNTSGTITADITATCAATPASFTLSATDGVNPAVTTTLNVGVTDSAVATQLAFGQQPTNANSGATITPPVTVQVLNACGAVVNSSGASVTLAIATGNGSLGGTTTVSAINGVATFSNLTVTGSGAQSLMATSTGLSGALSNTFNITAANAAPTITANPTAQTITSGGTGNSTITITDEDVNSVVLTASSNNQTLVPDGNISFNTTTGATRILSAASVSGQTGTAVITITATDAGSLTGTATYTLTVNAAANPTVTLSIAPATGTETAQTQFTATVTASSNVSSAQTVDFALTSGTAGAADFTAIPATITIPAGSNTGTATFNVVDDTIFEGATPETATFAISNPSSGITLGATTTATVSITDNDSQPTVSIGNVTQAEGNAGTTAFNFAVTLSNATTQTVTVNYSTFDGTAIAPGDYTAVVNGTVTIPAGSTSGTATVQVNGDTANEADEMFTVALSNPVNATILTSPGTGTITNDDALPSISINDVSITEGDSGTTPLTFTVSLNAASGQTVTVNYNTADNSAAAGSDFFAATGTVTFAPGVTSQPVSIDIVGDTVSESTETFFVNLSAAANAIIADSQGVGTINDNDAAAGTVTLSQPACGGLARSPLAAGTMNDALLCFTLTANSGTTTFTALSVPFTSDPTVKFTNPKLYRSIDTDYSTTADNTLVAMGTVTTTSFEFAGFTARPEEGNRFVLFAPSLAAGANNFFVVADVLPTVNSTTPQSQPSISPSNITITGGTVDPNSPTATGPNFAFVAAPTADRVTVGGRVTNSRGQRIETAFVTLIESDGTSRTVAVDEAGNYRFDDVIVGQTLVISASARGFRFRQPTQVLTLTEETLTVNFLTTARGGRE